MNSTWSIFFFTLTFRSIKDTHFFQLFSPNPNIYFKSSVCDGVWDQRSNYCKSRDSRDTLQEKSAKHIHENIPSGKQTVQIYPLGMSLCVRMDVVSSLPVCIIPPYPCIFSVSAKFPQCCCCARSRACWGLFLKPAFQTHTKVLLIQSLCQGLAEQICCSHREKHSKLLLPFSHIPSHLKRLVNSSEYDTGLSHVGQWKASAAAGDVRKSERWNLATVDVIRESLWREMVSVTGRESRQS